MKRLIKKIIVLMFAGVCFLSLAYGGVVTDRAGIGNVTNPTDLQVSGRVSCSSFTLTTNPQAYYILTSSTLGKAVWQVNPNSNLINSTNTWTASNTWNSTGTFLSKLAVNGNVGISTSSPSYALDVFGFIRSTAGFICPDGSTITTATGLGNFVPYQNAIQDVDLSTWSISASSGTFIGNMIIGSNNTDPTNPEELKIDLGSSHLPNVISGYQNINNYIQLNIQNKNNGNNASSDIVATADNGSETNNYIDMGINGSGYSNSSYSIGGPDDGYVYETGNNLEIGTEGPASPGTAVIKFHTGGTLASNERMRIDASGNVGIGMGTTTIKQVLGTPTLQVNGNTLVIGTSGWTAGSSAIMYMGDTDNFIEATRGLGATIQAKNSPNAVFISTNSGGIGLGTASPNEMCTVQGRFSLQETTAPPNSAGYGKFYANSSDKQLYCQDESGNQTQLSYDYAVFEEQEASGSDGGAGTPTTWTARTITDTPASRGSSITRSGNDITLSAGTYHIVASVPFYNCSYCKSRFYNTTDSSTAIYGTSNYQSGAHVTGKSLIDGIVAVSSSKTFEVQYYINTNNSGQDLGHNASTGQSEVYTRVYVRKIN